MRVKPAGFARFLFHDGPVRMFGDDMIRDIGAAIINMLMGFMLEGVRRLTKSGRPVRGADPIKTGIHLISPIEPSERSGGGKAVKELAELFSKRLRVRFILLPSIAGCLAEKRKKTAEVMMSGIPAQKTSSQFLFGGGVVEKLLKPGIPVFVEFSEGAAFLLLRRRLDCFTILRDHEILLRRYDRHEDGPRRITKRVREASTRYLCRAFLRNIYEKVDVVVTLTREDALYIQKHFRPIGGKIVTVPVAFEPPARKGETDRAASGAVTAVDNGEARDLLFLGNFFHRPNIEALEWFLQKCAPHLEPGFTLHLCGMDGPIRGMQYAEDYIKIVRHGFVEDLESEMGWVRIGVSPVISGGGTRIKTLYLGATGRVVVTTPLGNEGIGFRDGEEAIIRQDGCSMAGELNAIAKDPAERRRLGSNAAKKVEEDFSPERIWNYYRKKVFQQAMEKVG